VLAEFWLHHERSRLHPDPKLIGRRVLVIDAEDTFTAMLGHQLRSLGLAVTIRRFDEPGEPSDFDMVVIGPGPGDPRDVNHPKIASLRHITEGLLRDRIPFLSVCLGHQVLCGLLGFELIRKEVPNQGFQREIELFGQRARVGFYNTFTARSDTNDVECAAVAATVQVSRDADSNEVHALRGPGFRSVQFHPESVLSRDGVAIISSLLAALLADTEPKARLAVAAT
jgi:phenazine biosynthesis protein phzE